MARGWRVPINRSSGLAELFSARDASYTPRVPAPRRGLAMLLLTMLADYYGNRRRQLIEALAPRRHSGACGKTDRR
jgi:hypothetical protein